MSATVMQFQTNMLLCMMQLERTFFDLAATCNRNCLVICDRGFMDASAYCTPQVLFFHIFSCLILLDCFSSLLQDHILYMHLLVSRQNIVIQIFVYYVEINVSKFFPDRRRSHAPNSGSMFEEKLLSIRKRSSFPTGREAPFRQEEKLLSLRKRSSFPSGREAPFRQEEKLLSLLSVRKISSFPSFQSGR